MNGIERDQRAAMRDLIAFSPHKVSVDGITYKAHIERGGSSKEASEFGADITTEELAISFDSKGAITTYESPIVYKGARYRITGIEHITDDLKTLTVETDTE